MGSKRKHNQSSTAGTGRPDVQPSTKKAKVDREQSVVLSRQTATSSITPVASPYSKRQAPKTTQPEQDATSGLSKSARKRLRKRVALREAKKNSLSSNKFGQATKESDGQRPAQKPLAKPDLKKLKASHTNASSESAISGVPGSIDDSKISQVNETLDDHSPPAEATASSKKWASKIKRSDSVRHEFTLQHSNGSASEVVAKSPANAKAGISKRQRRRQSAQLKRDHASNHENEGLGHRILVQGKSTPQAKGSPTKQESSTDSSILHKTTQTTLLPVPKKQWINEAEHELPVVDTTLRTEITKTSLMPRPTKEWVEGNLPTHAGDSVSESPHAVDKHDHSPAEVEPTTTRSPSASPTHSSPSSSHETPQPQEVERPFAAVGLPPVTQPSATRPGINSIASFSLSSRRHPVDVLAKSRRISGLSGMRMDTGMVGSGNKPINSLKANSVPSYSGRGDVKAAFVAFNKFAHGGESSDSDDESEESESEVEAETNRPAARTDVALVVAPSVSTEVRAPQHSRDGGEGQLDNTAHTDIPVGSDSNPSAESNDGNNVAVVNNDDGNRGHETQESDGYVTETPPISNPNGHNASDGAQYGGIDALTEPLNNAPRILGQKDLPLFSDFKPKHDMQPTDEAPERSSAFLGQDPGGSISVPGPGSDHDPIGDDQRVSALRVPISEYQASQEADELYRSIEDISREVFGSTRTLPDCKPLPNPLDVNTEPLVTEYPSDHGVDFHPLGQKTSDKDVALRHIARGSSPMVYIVSGINEAVDSMSYVDDDRLGGDEGRNTESGPAVVSKQAETERCSSPQSSLSTLTPSPTPSGGSPNPTHPSRRTAQGRDDENDEDPMIEPVEADNSAGSPDKKKRKMTGSSSKHFSPQKQPSRQDKSSVKAESNDDIKPSALEDLPELPKPPKGKKKGTGKTSEFFTPTPSPTKKSPKSKSKTPRPPAGTSTCPVPPTTSAHFGLIQEKLWQTPFWLLIAVTFLNKTAGRSAVPIFRSLQTLYPTPELLSQANHEDLVDLIATLGLQNQRAKKLVAIAKTWCEDPPVKGRRWRCLHYPIKGDGKEYKKGEVIKETSDSDSDSDSTSSNDPNAVRGALEIAHIPGCGPYAWDSWRIFCRDVLRGRAEDYNGKRASDPDSFEPEWQRVLPLDKELRACLRWMWLREGWVWDCESGAKRAATADERRAGELGEMTFGDEREEKFAKDAAVAAAVDDDGDGEGGSADVEVGEGGVADNDVRADHVDVVADEVVSATPAVKKVKQIGSRKTSIARRELDVPSDDEIEIPSLRRSRRNKRR